MKKTFTLLKAFGCLFTLVCTGMVDLQAQTPFDGPNYANHWIVPGQTYVRLGVKVGGLQKVTFDALEALAFPTTTPQNFHLYHRGKEVTIISTENREIVFYGETNDGSSDSLLYRPMSSRMNPYSSFFSEEGAYFLTANSEPRAVMPLDDEPINTSIALEPYHLKTDVVIYGTVFSQTLSGDNPAVINSYYERGESYTGSQIVNTSATQPSTLWNYSLVNRVGGVSPELKILLHGRSNVMQNILLSVGKNLSTLGTPIAISINGLNAKETTLTINEGDINSDGTGVFNLQSTVYSSTPAFNGKYSIAYYSLTYAQTFDMADTQSSFFKLPASTLAWSRVLISGTVEGSRIFDITDPSMIKEIKGNWASGSSEVMVERQLDKPLTLYVTNATNTIQEVTLAVMDNIVPASYDYLIVTNSDLFNAAKEYEVYRASPNGGGYKTLVVKINDVYNQFNYGEPSPVAIRRFVDFMISDGNRNKYLLLIGSTTTREATLLNTREISGQVPTIGFPGSDVLLVAGLGGAHVDVPSIPVGRINALNPLHVKNYLAKLMSYEGTDAIGATWRKKVTEMYGGKSVTESNGFISTYTSLDSRITGAPFSGEVKLVAQPMPTPTVGDPNPYVAPANASVSNEINEGTGLLTYFGHGTETDTHFNIGFYSNTTDFSYNNPNKYPVMYFMGCYIGNMFNISRSPLSSDWVNAANGGAIAFVTNTYFGYATPSERHLNEFTKSVFNYPDATRKPLGNILQDVAGAIANSPGYSDLDRQNIHQFLLQGDPALRILEVKGALPVTFLDLKAEVNGHRVSLKWATTHESNNSHFEILRSSDGKMFEEAGLVDAKLAADYYSRLEYSWLEEYLPSGSYFYRIRQVDIDGKSNLSKIVSVKVGEADRVTLGPNPTKGLMKIYGGSPSGYLAKVFSISGIELFQSKVSTTLDLSEMKSGAYLVTLIDDQGMPYTFKIIRE